MSGASDKARFYLEQAVPQLQEFKEKKIFTDEEIQTLVKKRSDFEHKVLAREVQAIEFARYAAWEIGLENLRSKRCKRMRIKNLAHTGQARIFSIFDRGTRKRPGDLPLWMSYLEYCKQAKATKKFRKIITDAIRLHPTKAELWLYGARCALEMESDMNGARSYMQRGTRFCLSREMWIEYAKLEMIWLAKVAMRRRILGLDIDTAMEGTENTEEHTLDTNADMIALPKFNVNSFQPKQTENVKVDDSEATKDPMTTPALNGAIPLAIFDAARKHPFFCASASEDFFDMFAMFTQVRCLPKILQHVLDVMMELYPKDPFTCNCYTRQPIIGLDPSSPEFPVALGSTLDRLNESLKETKDKTELSKKTRSWMDRIAGVQDLDPGIKTVLQHTRRKLE